MEREILLRLMIERLASHLETATELLAEYGVDDEDLDAAAEPIEEARALARGPA